MSDPRHPSTFDTPIVDTRDRLNELEMQRHVHGKGASRSQTDWLLRTCNEALAERDRYQDLLEVAMLYLRLWFTNDDLPPKRAEALRLEILQWLRERQLGVQVDRPT